MFILEKERTLDMYEYPSIDVIRQGDPVVVRCSNCGSIHPDVRKDRITNTRVKNQKGCKHCCRKNRPKPRQMNKPIRVPAPEPKMSVCEFIGCRATKSFDRKYCDKHEAIVVERRKLMGDHF